MNVRKANGKLVPLDIKEIQEKTKSAEIGLDNVYAAEVEVDSQIQFFDGITTEEITKSLIKTAVDKIDIDKSNYTFFASRLFIKDLAHKVGRTLGGIKGNAYSPLHTYFEYGEKNGKIIIGLKDKFNLNELDRYIQPKRDLLFTYLGIKTFYDRYILKNNAGDPFEMPQHLFMGVSMFVAQKEENPMSMSKEARTEYSSLTLDAEEQKKFVRTYWAKKFYDMMSTFEVMAATPTLSNGRTPRHQLSSCFIKGTKVRTIDGYKDIDKIVEGDLVLTHNNRFMKVYELFKRDFARNLITLNINGLIDDLSATEEHPVLSIKKKDIDCIRKLGSCIKSQGKNKRCFSMKGEYREDCKLLNKEFSSEWSKIDDLNKGDFVSISFPKNINKTELYITDYVKTKNIIEKDGKVMFKRTSSSFYSTERSFLNNQIIPVTNKINITKEFMTLIGYFLAEGHINKDMSSITFTFGSKEKNYIEETKNIIEKIFNIKASVNVNKDNSTNIIVHSKIIGLFFNELVGTGFDKKKLNNDLLFADPKTQEGLLIGAIRGYGCALEEGYQLTMSNKSLIKQLFEISLRCGLSPYMKRDKKKSKLATIKASHLKIGTRTDKDFIISVGKNLNKINFEINASSTLRYFWHNEEYFMKVIERDDKYIEDKVYNIEVEEDHSYSVSGVNVHNCYIGSTPDNIEGIFDTFKEQSLLSKFGGGIGWDWMQVRGASSAIDGTKNAAGGIVPFLKIDNDVALAVDQLGCVIKDSYVKVLKSVETNGFMHDFRKEYERFDLNEQELLDNVSAYASNFAFEYGKFSKNHISSLFFDYIQNKDGLEKLTSIYGMTRDQYKKVIVRYKKINKGLPEGFEILKGYNDYAISKEGIIINLKSLKPLSLIKDRKGYIRVTIGKESKALHKLLVKQYISENINNLTIDHKDENKCNNRLNNFEIISNGENVSRGWNSSSKKRTEMSRVRKYLSGVAELNGKKRGTHRVTINNITEEIIPISKVRIGDLIKSFNIDTNEIEYKTILSKYDIDVKIEDQIKIIFSDDSFIITSKWHPSPKLKDGSYVYIRTDELKIGDIGLNSEGEEKEIKDIEIDTDISYPDDFKNKELFYDLTVKDNNNYFCSSLNKDGEFHLIHNTRKGAIAVYIEPWHIDVEDFLSLKKNSGEERRRAHDLFPALWLNDIFMERVEADEEWTLFSPENVPGLTETYGEEFNKLYRKYEADESIPKRVVMAKDIWKETLRQYFETGNPFLTFKDRANEVNPNKHAGIIRSSNLCVTGDTKMATQFGLISAKELEEKNKKLIATYDYRTNGDRENRGTGTAECIEMYKTKENADIYEVKTKDGYSIKSTNWHEYYIQRNKSIIKIPLKDVKLTDKLLIQSSKGQFGKEGSYKLGLLTGLIAGDGTFSKSRKGYSTSHIDLYNDDMRLGDIVKEYSDKIIDEEYSSLLNAHNKDFKNKYPKEISHTENSKKIRFTNVRLGRILDEKYNFKKETKLIVPDFVYKGKEETVKGYLRGLFIADGTVNVLKNDKTKTFGVQLGNISENYLKEIQVLLSNFGIRSKITKMERKGKCNFKYTTVDGINKEYISKDLYRLSINGDNSINFIYEIGFIGKKQEKALNVMAERERQGYPRKGRKVERFEAEITSIQYVGKEDVYDTTQLVNHSLIFNGLVTGNCTEIFQNTSPNKYLIEVEYEDGTKESFEEEFIITTDDGAVKPAKKISSLDSLNGKQVFFVGKEKIDGETAVCNLASVNLSKVNTKEKFEEIIPTAIRFLDNVIDLNFYPEIKTKKTNLKSRAVGLGVMGEAQMLAEAKIMFGSQEHFDKIDEIMEIFSYNAIKASSLLGKEKGSYPNFEGSEWSKGIFPADNARDEVKELTTRESTIYDWNELAEKHTTKHMRNGYLMAIAPTSSISILTGTTQAIEPVFKRFWREENLSGVIPVVAPNLSPDTWQFYTPAFELDQTLLVKAGAVRQKWLDQGQSLNIFIALESITGKKLHRIYMDAWKYGIKSTYYLRGQSPKALDEEDTDVEDRSQECTGCQ